MSVRLHMVLGLLEKELMISPSGDEHVYFTSKTPQVRMSE